jgi:hypothetical protein
VIGEVLKEKIKFLSMFSSSSFAYSNMQIVKVFSIKKTQIFFKGTVSPD